MSNIKVTLDDSHSCITHQSIGVFDSGVGGISVLKHIHDLLPNESLIYVADSLHAPYGNKTPGEIRARCFEIADFLIAQHVKAIVVACNTATAAAISAMREKYSASGLNLPIIGMEPAVKPAAAATKNGVIGVLATVGTLKSAQFAALLASCGQEVQVITQGCPGLVECVEKGALNDATTLNLVRQYCAPLLAAGADTIVLGCTHYPFLQPLIHQVVGEGVTLIETGLAVAKHLQHRLDNACFLLTQPQMKLTKPSTPPTLTIWTNSPQCNAEEVIARLWSATGQQKACANVQALTIKSF
jgi:glutamate racemase